MEGHVVFPSQAVSGSSPLFAFRNAARVVQFDTEVHTEDEYREVKAYTYAVTPCNLFVELVPEEYAVRLLLVVFYRPYVTCVEEGCQFEEGEHLEAVLEVHIQFDITHL